MSEELLLLATHVTRQPLTVSQTVYSGTVGKWLCEHQKPPAPLEKAAYRKMLKVVRLSDAHSVFVPRKNSVVNYPEGSPTLYQIIDDNYRVKVPGARIGSCGAAGARGRYATARFLDLFVYSMRSHRKKDPVYHTK